MNALLKKILPWHLRQTLAWARFYFAKRHPPFEGVFSGFSEVPEKSPWRSPRWSEPSRRLTEDRRRVIGDSLPEGISPGKSLLPVLVSGLLANRASRANRADLKDSRRGPVRILDFGGATGIDYANLLASLGGSSPEIFYHVVDTKTCCEAGEKLWADDPGIVFTESLPPPPHHFDVVYSSSVINLIEDWKGQLRKLTEYRPSVLLFCKNSLHDGPSFVRRQVNMGSGTESPIWALGFEDFTQVLRENGYQLAFRAYGSESYNVDNYDDAHKVGRTVNLLFIRSSEPPEPA